MANRFEQLDVFKRSYMVSLELHRASLQFPKVEQYGLADQLRRSSKSICANIAEGFAKQSSKAEFIRYLLIAMGSAEEVRVWLRYCVDLEYIEKDQWKCWRSEYEQITKMLHGLITSIKKKNVKSQQSR